MAFLDNEYKVLLGMGGLMCDPSNIVILGLRSYIYSWALFKISSILTLIFINEHLPSLYLNSSTDNYNTHPLSKGNCQWADGLQL